MKSISSALAAHLVGEVTTLATCWRVTRKDGREFFFTDHDRDLAFDGNAYLASSGYSRSAIANDAGMAVDNLDVEGVLDHEQISEKDLRAGLFDHAEVHVFLVNWADLRQGKLRLRRGWFGEVQLTDQRRCPTARRATGTDRGSRLLGDAGSTMAPDPAARRPPLSTRTGNPSR